MLRRIVKYFVPEVRRVWDAHNEALKKIAPILKQRAIDEKQEDYKKRSSYSVKNCYLFCIRVPKVGAVLRAYK